MSKAIGIRGDVFTAVVYGFYENTKDLREDGYNTDCVILGIQEVDPIESLKLKRDIQFQLRACYTNSFVYTAQFTDVLVKTMYPDIEIKRKK